MSRIAVVGEGVIGLSSALALLKSRPRAKITVFSDRPFEETCSFGPAGLFRIDNPKEIGKASFARFLHLYRTKNGDETGIKLLSGTIMSDDKAVLESQETAYGDTVFGFRWLSDEERVALFPNPSKHAIFFTGIASEGCRYIPYLKNEIKEEGGDRVQFVTRKIESLEELGSDYEVVINCGGLHGGKLAGDDDSVFPIRGIGIKIHAPWHKHFYYKNFDTFTIPMNDAVTLGSVKQIGSWDTTIRDEDREDIWKRYLEIHPAMKGARVISEWIALRPGRKEIRLETQTRKSKEGRQFLVVHNYGHGGNGFTLGWGCALRVAAMVDNELPDKASL